jgi:hypothetical protein
MELRLIYLVLFVCLLFNFQIKCLNIKKKESSMKSQDYLNKSESLNNNLSNKENTNVQEDLASEFKQELLLIEKEENSNSKKNEKSVSSMSW